VRETVEHIWPQIAGIAIEAILKAIMVDMVLED
jgi:hypothetical protein